GDCLGGVTFVAHAPPGMSVDHEADLWPHRLAHEDDRFEVLLRTKSWAHFVCAESHCGDRGGFFGETGWRHVHAGAAIEFDAVALASADDFGERGAFKFCGEIH